MKKGKNMKRSKLFVVPLLFVLTAGCKDLGEPSTDDIVNYSGTIIQETAQSFLIESDTAFENHLKTFYPLNLENPFKIGGLRLRFSGKIETAPFAQYAHPNIRLSRMELIER
jgi:hypothetical protein